MKILYWTHKHQAHKNQQRGFTLIELMIATMAFSVILLGATTAVVQIGRMYYKGVVTSKTQEIARRTIEDISRAIQFNDAKIVRPAPVDISVNGVTSGQVTIQALCVGTTRYTYSINAQVDHQNDVNKHRLRHALWQDTVTNPNACGVNLPDLGEPEPSPGGHELLGRFMRLGTLDVDPVANPTPITVSIIYGDDDLLLPDANNPTNCRGAVQGAQWCAVSTLTTQARQRINPEE